MVRGNHIDSETKVLAPPPQGIIIIIIITIIVIIYNYIGILYTTHDDEIVTYMFNNIIIQCDSFITN